VDGEQRRLNASEILELRQYIRARRGSGIAAAAVLFFISMGMMVNVPALGRGEQIPVFLIATLPFAWAVVLVVRTVHMLWFGRDLSAGFVEHRGGIEKLRSGRIWWEDGRPAAWRLR